MPKLSIPPLTFFIAFLLMLLPCLAQAVEHVYQQPEEFIDELFKVKPKVKLLLLTKDMHPRFPASLAMHPDSCVNDIGVRVLERYGFWKR